MFCSHNACMPPQEVGVLWRHIQQRRRARQVPLLQDESDLGTRLWSMLDLNIETSSKTKNNNLIYPIHQWKIVLCVSQTVNSNFVNEYRSQAVMRANIVVWLACAVLRLFGAVLCSCPAGRSVCSLLGAERAYSCGNPTTTSSLGPPARKEHRNRRL